MQLPIAAILLSAVLDPLQLKCVLEDNQFTSEISFATAPDGRIEGEVANFAEHGGAFRQYLGGNVLFDVVVTPQKIRGNTGDPRGTVSPFVLTQLGPVPTGPWVFEHFENPHSVHRALFRCTYGARKPR
jgi:hypothetical protein